VILLLPLRGIVSVVLVYNNNEEANSLQRIKMDTTLRLQRLIPALLLLVLLTPLFVSAAAEPQPPENATQWLFWVAVSMATNFDPLWPDKTDPPP
jgi:peptidoglycan/LPS O-acetylase OafA/YrhL